MTKNSERPSNIMSPSFWWIINSICLPLSIPWIIYNCMCILRRMLRKSDMEGKVVMITGASSGLGEALAHTFYAQGCHVVLAARRVEELDRVKADLLRTHNIAIAHIPIIVPLDLADINALPSCVNKVLDIYGHIDILINNGGVSHRGDILNTKVDIDIKIMLVNYFGPAALTKAVLPKMVERRCGHIVFVSSVQGLIAIPERSAYAASKHALQAFADTLRAEVHQHNLEVSVVSPGYIKTALSLNALTGTGEKHGVMDATTAKGYTASYVSKEILDLVLFKKNELILCPATHKVAIFLRTLLPSVYFWIMSRRAKKTTQL